MKPKIGIPWYRNIVSFGSFGVEQKYNFRQFQCRQNRGFYVEIIIKKLQGFPFFTSLKVLFSNK